MKTLLRFIVALGLASASLGIAEAIPLSTLLQGGSITASDKLFSEWSYVYAASDPLRVFDPANIEVTPLNDGGYDPGPGLRFDVSNNELSVTGDGVYAYVDLKFSFHVTALDPAHPIKDNSLYLFSASRTNQGDNGAYIQEFVGTTPGGNDLVNFKQVESSWLDPNSVDQPIDTAAFTPQNGIWVTKNILVWASGVDETASLTAFAQRFSQVPEPGTLALLGIAGLAGFLARRLQGLKAHCSWRIAP